MAAVGDHGYNATSQWRGDAAHESISSRELW